MEDWRYAFVHNAMSHAIKVHGVEPSLRCGNKAGGHFQYPATQKLLQCDPHWHSCFYLSSSGT
jgi:hypothetical protein